MKILYLGDVMGDAGQQVVEQLLPELKQEYAPDVIVAQAENLSSGRGMTVEDTRKMQSMGIDFFTGGNWTPYLDETHPLLEDESEPVIGPANFSASPGPGFKYLDTPNGKVLFVSLLGQVVGKPLPHTDNPLLIIDKILEEELAKRKPAAIVVNFHGDFSSEKRIIGYYLDGKASLVVGDHWHVPTADAMVLPNGTAHISDVGMCGNLHSSLGVSLDSVIPRWKTGIQTRNVLDDSRPWQLNAVLVDVNHQGLANSIQQIQRIVD